jgi:Kef-type K+ transport system membrane component KefB
MEFSTIAVLLVTASLFGVIAKLLKQPILVGYLFAGVVLSYFGVIKDVQSLDALAQIGVTLLLFLLGIEMNFSDIKSFGKVSVVTGIGQILFTFLSGFLIAGLLNFPTLPSVYIAIALTFSSTIIIVKLLSEKKDLQSLYGRISVGFLLVQDFVAIGILMFLDGLGRGQGTPAGNFFVLGKALALFAMVWFLSKKILPRFFDMVSSGSTELLFIVSIAWAVGVSAFVAGPFGFSPEIGGFLAGFALSGLPEHLQISSRAKPLRDFFLTIFFLILGTKLVVTGGFVGVIIPALIFAVFVLIGHPIILLVILGILGYRSKTSFKAGLSSAQISEFSFVLMSVGAGLGHITPEHVSIVVMVGVITMTVSTYMILDADKLYVRIHKVLRIFQKKVTLEEAYIAEINMQNHIVVVGSDRTGNAIVKYLNSKNKEFVVVDHNPAVYKRLTADNIPCVFGDITDDDILEYSNIDKAKLVISTTSNLEDNIRILEYLKEKNESYIFIATALSKYHGTKLYEKGASYVLIPEVVAGDYVTHLLETHELSLSRIKEMGQRHFNKLVFK